MNCYGSYTGYFKAMSTNTIMLVREFCHAVQTTCTYLNTMAADGNGIPSFFSISFLLVSSNFQCY